MAYTHILFTRVDEQTKAQIALAAADLGMSQANFIREAITQALAEYREFADKPSSRAPVVGGDVLPISQESAIAEGIE